MQDNNKEKFPELTAEEIANSTVFAKPDTEYKPPKKGGQNIVLKTAVALIIVAVLIFAIIFINAKFGKNNGSSYLSNLSTTSDVTSDPTLYAEKTAVENISEVTIKNENGTFTFTPKDGEEDEILWYVAGVDKNYCHTENTALTVQNCAKIAYYSATDAVAGRNYGFSDPAATVTVKHKDGKYTFTVTKPFKNSEMTGAYIKFDNDDKIYLVSQSVAEDYIYDATRYISTAVFTAVTEDDNNADYFNDGTLSKFDYIEYSGNMTPNGTVRIVPYGRNNSTQEYKMVKPYNLNVEHESVNDLVNILKENIEASDIYYYNRDGIDASVIKEYALNNPDAVITYRVANKTHTIKLSLSTKHDFYYSVIFDDAPIIYKVSSKTFPFLEYTVAELASDTLILENIDGLSNIEMKFGGETYKFDISTKSTTNSDGETESDIVAKYGKKTLDTDDFRNYYYYMLKISPYVTDNSLLNVRPDDAKEYLTLTFTPQTALEDPPLTLTVFKTDNQKRYYLELNGNPIGLCGTDDVDLVVNNLENLLTGVTIKEIS